MRALNKLRVYWHNYDRTYKTVLKLKKEKKIPNRKKEASKNFNEHDLV